VAYVYFEDEPGRRSAKLLSATLRPTRLIIWRDFGHRDFAADSCRFAFFKMTAMDDWLHNLPLVWMALLIFGGTYLVTVAIYYIVAAIAVGEGPRHFKAVSPGILPPLGILFGLFVAFTAAQVGSDNQQASATVEREASALRSVAILATVLPAESQTRLRALIRDYIEETATHEWPMMAHRYGHCPDNTSVACRSGGADADTAGNQRRPENSAT
jgi:hypothetical protein